MHSNGLCSGNLRRARGQKLIPDGEQWRVLRMLETSGSAEWPDALEFGQDKHSSCINAGQIPRGIKCIW